MIIAHRDTTARNGGASENAMEARKANIVPPQQAIQCPEKLSYKERGEIAMQQQQDDCAILGFRGIRIRFVWLRA